MLTTNTILTGFGRLEKINNGLVTSKWLPKQFYAQYRLSEPRENNTYILTTLSRPALIERLRGVTRALKISLIIFGSLGVAVGIYCIYKNVSKYIQKRRRDHDINQARIQRLKNQRNRNNNNRTDNQQQNDNNNNNNNNSHETTCVICLVNPREIVLLDCGHVCLCMDCLERLPNTNCPICRVSYRTFAPVYMP